jgi:hypothetical protein
MVETVTPGTSSGYSPAAVLVELNDRNPPLAAVTVLTSALFAGFLVGIATDPRTLAGEPVWLKPAKFAGSIALFTGSLAWLTPHLGAPDGVLRTASRGIAAGMVVEIALIGGQAARGVESHFNTATPFDTAVYALMGATIVGSVGLLAWLLARSWRRESDVAPAFAWGIRLGVLLFVVGSFQGGAMNAISGAATGSGPTLPVVRWNLGGDFRVAHFVGLHAIEVLPLVGYATARSHQLGRLQRPLLVVAVATAAYVVVLAAAFAFAVAPLLG